MQVLNSELKKIHMFIPSLNRVKILTKQIKTDFLN
jgi:hypothetical protein